MIKIKNILEIYNENKKFLNESTLKEFKEFHCIEDVIEELITNQDLYGNYFNETWNDGNYEMSKIIVEEINEDDKIETAIYFNTLLNFNNFILRNEDRF